MEEGPYYSLVKRHKDAGYSSYLAYRRQVLELGAADKALRAEFRLMCSRDLLFWVNTFVWTNDPRPTAVVADLPFATWDFQDPLLLKVADATERGYSLVINKTRDMGATWCVLAVYLWFWLYRPGSLFLLGSKSEPYVDGGGDMKALMPRLEYMLRKLPTWLLPNGFTFKTHRIHLKLMNPENGSRIDGEPTSGEFGAGDRRTGVYGDEWAKHKHGYEALASSKDVTRSRIFTSTPMGTGNSFYTLWNKPRLPKIKLHWTQHPLKRRGLYEFDKGGKVKLLDDFEGKVLIQDQEFWFPYGNDELPAYPFEEFYDDKYRLRSPEYDNAWVQCGSRQEMAQEWECDFLESGGQFYDQSTLDRLKESTCREPYLVGELGYKLDPCEPTGFTSMPRGRLSLWCSLDKSGPHRGAGYVIGCDISQGKGASSSVAAVLDRATGEKVGEYVDSHSRPDEFAEAVAALCMWFVDLDGYAAYVVWEAAGPGEPFGDRLMELGISDVYMRKRKERSLNPEDSDEPGWYPSVSTKFKLLSSHLRALDRTDYIERSRSCLAECQYYMREHSHKVTYMYAGEGNEDVDDSAHGDRVIATALAVMLLDDRPVTLDDERRVAPVGSFAWYEQEERRTHSASKNRWYKTPWQRKSRTLAG